MALGGLEVTYARGQYILLVGFCTARYGILFLGLAFNVLTERAVYVVAAIEPYR